MFDLEQAIAAWRQQMLVAGIKSSVSLDELESHLRDEIDHQLNTGYNLEQSFQVAIENIGSATSIKKEFKKVSFMNTKKTETIIGALGFAAFAIIAIGGLFSNVVSATAGEKVLGIAAVAFTGALLFVSAHAWRFLLVISLKPLRFTVATVCAIVGAVATTLVFDVVMPKFDLTVGQITVVVLWGLQPFIIGALVFGGLIEAAERRPPSSIRN
jgi:hypothetical protein